MSSEKRKRDLPFQPSEKNNLIDIVTQHFAIIECKKTDSISTKVKNGEWAKIAKEFNSTSNFKAREWQVLKNLWGNLKKKARSAISQQTQDMFATGGGPPKKPKEDPILERVMELIRSNVQGFTNPFDNDVNHSAHYEDENIENRDDNTDTDRETSIQGNDWSSCTPQLLRTPKSVALRQHNYVNLDSAPIEIVDNFYLESELQSPPAPNIKAATQESAIEASPVAFKEDSRTAASTPQLAPKASSSGSRHVASRRRPVLKQAEADSLAQAKIKTLNFSNEQAQQQHEVTMRILSLQEAQEKEKLKQETEKTEQEKLRTELVRLELMKVERDLNRTD